MSNPIEPMSRIAKLCRHSDVDNLANTPAAGIIDKSSNYRN